MIFRKTVLAFVMLIAVMANFKTVEAAETDETSAYLYYGTIDSFVKNVNLVLDSSEDAKNYKLYNLQYYKTTGNLYVGETTLFPGASIKFYSDPNNYAVYYIEINTRNTGKEAINATFSILSGCVLATGMPFDTFKQFRDSVQQWINSIKTVPTYKTFKVWNNQIRRYIVVKLSAPGDQSGLEIQIYSKFS